MKNRTNTRTIFKADKSYVVVILSIADYDENMNSSSRIIKKNHTLWIPYKFYNIGYNLLVLEWVFHLKNNVNLHTLYLAHTVLFGKHSLIPDISDIKRLELFANS